MSRTQGARIVRRLVVRGALALAVANMAGAAVVFTMLAFVLPVPDGTDEVTVRLVNLILGASYAVIAGGVGGALGVREVRRRLAWLLEGRAPDRAERRRTIRIPLGSSLRQLFFWVVAAIGFTIGNGLLSVLLGVEIGLTILIGGLTTTATTYLLLERLNRPAVARALAGHHVRRAPGAGVAWKTVLTWGLGTGLPLVGLTLLAGLSLGLDVTRQELALAVFVLGLTALATGFGSIVVYARGLADPLRDLRTVIRRIETGDLDVEVAITDTTEVGVLQSGVDRMVAGLRDRDRLRDLFGRHVGEDIARRAIDEGVELGGVERTAAALFVDVVDSTGLARRDSPVAVLELLNDFFAVVVEVVDEHGGVVNKFMGDAALAIWGAPLGHPDPASSALACARTLAGRLSAEVEGLSAGIGVACGLVVAGNLGAATRLEYTVIGDPVNLASRLSAHANAEGLPVLADADTVGQASPEEQARWRGAGEVTVRGRDVPTPLAVPAGDQPGTTLRTEPPRSSA